MPKNTHQKNLSAYHLKIIGEFGGKEQYFLAVRELEMEIYAY